MKGRQGMGWLIAFLVLLVVFLAYRLGRKSSGSGGGRRDWGETATNAREFINGLAEKVGPAIGRAKESPRTLRTVIVVLLIILVFVMMLNSLHRITDLNKAMGPDATISEGFQPVKTALCLIVLAFVEVLLLFKGLKWARRD
jgi:hypothetical protein